MLQHLEAKLAELDCHLAEVGVRRAMVMALILDVRRVTSDEI
ncbi:MAG TPA: hypothetical protein VG407_00015 [Caulobacteraceae bacterium]|nr:hypothetical protein [Caulobacteraceae bacterium]